MRKSSICAALGVLALSACATTPSASPVQVTRFVEPAAAAQLGQGTIFVETAPGMGGDTLALSPYKAAIARELAALGYVETSRVEATQLAQVRVEKFVSDEPQGRRGPVSVGVGGSTGSYGSGVGLGVGLNLGGGRSQETLDTQMGVMIRDKNSGETYWEGRAQFSVSPDSRFADSQANAAAVADALFRGFPGNNGETIEVEVDE